MNSKQTVSFYDCFKANASQDFVCVSVWLSYEAKSKLYSKKKVTNHFYFSL